MFRRNRDEPPLCLYCDSFKMMTHLCIRHSGFRRNPGAPMEKAMRDRRVVLDSGFRRNDGSRNFTHQVKQVEPLDKSIC